MYDYSYGGMDQQQNPYMDRMRQYQQPRMMRTQPYDAVVRVSGIDGAKAYQMPPNSAAPMFSDREDVFFIKTTDGAGFPTLQAYAYNKIDLSALTDTQESDVVTRKEFDDLSTSVNEMSSTMNEIKEMLGNAQQCVRKPSSKSSAATAE